MGGGAGDTWQFSPNGSYVITQHRSLVGGVLVPPGASLILSGDFTDPADFGRAQGQGGRRFLRALYFVPYRILGDPLTGQVIGWEMWLQPSQSQDFPGAYGQSQEEKAFYRIAKLIICELGLLTAPESATQKQKPNIPWAVLEARTYLDLAVMWVNKFSFFSLSYFKLGFCDF